MYSPLQKNKSYKNKTVPPQLFNVALVTTLVTLMVPILYIIGRAYEESYLKVYGLSTVLFEKSTQDYLYSALSGIFLSVWSTLLWLLKDVWLLITASIFGAVVTMFLPADKAIFRSWLKRTIGIVNKKLYLKVIGSGLVGGLVISVYLLVFLFIILVLAIPLSIGQSAGKDAANDEIKSDYKVCETKNRNDLTACVKVVKDDKTVAIGRIIATSASYVAIATNGKAVILNKEGLSFEVM